MFRKIAAPVLAGCICALAAPAYAQDRQTQPSETPAKKNDVTFDLGSSAPWYHVRGPRISGLYDSLKTGKLSFIYLTQPELGQKEANDFRALWNLPGRWLKGADVSAFAYRSPLRGFGTGIEASAGTKKAKVAGRVKAFADGMHYEELRVLTPHLDVSYGVQSDKGARMGYGYATVNWGKHDDTFSLGMDAGKTVWNNFSIERGRFGWFSMTGYSAAEETGGNWTTENYFGAGNNILRQWFSRDVDRFAPKQNIGPKERVDVLNFPTYLEFGDWSGEFRADRSRDVMFVNAGVGRTLTKVDGKLKGAKIGAGLGPEYASRDGRQVWKMGKELYAEVPVGSFSLSGYARIRENEGGFHVTLRKIF